LLNPYWGHLCHFNNKVTLPSLSVQNGREHFLCGSQQNIFFPSLFDDKPNSGKKNIPQSFSPSSFFPSSFLETKQSVRVEAKTYIIQFPLAGNYLAILSFCTTSATTLEITYFFLWKGNYLILLLDSGFFTSSQSYDHIVKF
jgi:hypothetical protein